MPFSGPCYLQLRRPCSDNEFIFSSAQQYQMLILVYRICTAFCSIFNAVGRFWILRRHKFFLNQVKHGICSSSPSLVSEVVFCHLPLALHLYSSQVISLELA
ncbi:hypothetical protein POM88_030369 [Heracleum sosnowskyi]|uniref:Uncharacterized protein n=1 Tax=Heracleum sosnowskyi TaxID=360622 RepID=A0AAD8MI10_9APIA|nr:hypothetical protein POM88_030369 [Heracleum sosnowskyi]